MQSYNDIEQLYNLTKSIRKYCEINSRPLPILSFRGTVKLHGTNSGIHITPDKQVIAQSRSRELSLDHDNYGFCQFVKYNESLIIKFYEDNWNGKDVIIFGEWVGSGIQRNVAISKFLERQLVIFDIMVDGKYIENKVEYKFNAQNVFNILEIPSYSITIDFNNVMKVQNELTEMLDSVANDCPWGKKFGITGRGEGIVFTHQSDDLRLIFKLKKDIDEDKTTKEKVPVDIEKLNKIEDLTARLLPTWRLEQGLEHINEISPENTGKYIKWVVQDVLKEEQNLIVESCLEWKAIAAGLTQKIKNFYFKKIQEAV